MKTGTPVIFAKLHSTFFIPTVGNMTDTLPSQSKTLPDFKMFLQDNGALLLQWSEGKYTKSFLIGSATVVGALLAPVETNPAPAVKKAA